MAGIITRSLSGKAEYVDDNVVVFKGIFLTEVSIVFGVPEATCTHMESTVTLLEDNHVCCKLQVFIDLLE